jgi:hypothetical protein
MDQTTPTTEPTMQPRAERRAAWPLRLAVWMLLLPGLALARTYDVELLVFAQPASGEDSEFWPYDASRPDARGALVLGGDDGQLSPLPGSTHELAYYRTLLDRQGFSTLFHGKWRQNIGSKAQTAPVYLNSGGIDPRMEGLLRFSLTRYLHVHTDLYLRNLESATVPGYRIRLHRKMRSSELHYLDHPKAGLLIVVRPVG